MRTGLLRWIWGFVLVCAVPADGKQRSYEELLAAMRKADQLWADQNYGPAELERARLEYLKTWTRTDVVSLGRNFEFTFNRTWSDVVLQRWGMIDHEAGLWCFLRYHEADRATRKERPYDFPTNGWRYTDYGGQSVAWCLLEVLIGWAEKDPIEAWRTLVEIDREISKYGLLNHMPINRLRVLSEKVARADPKFALGEFWRGPSQIRSYMLEGMCLGLPSGYPWKELMREVALSRKVDDPGMKRILRGPLMGRWMDDNPKEAVKWYESQEGEAVSQTFRRSFDWGDRTGDYGGFRTKSIDYSGQKVTSTLADAVSFWHSRSPAAARSWLRDHTELLPEIIDIKGYSDWERQDSHEMRKTLVYCLDKMERESLLRSINLNALEGFFSRDKKSRLHEIEMIRVSDELEAEILENLESDPYGW